MGRYHPHGDSSIYDALVRLAQPFAMRYPLVDGQGNFGSIDGDSAAAMRYTEARLTRLATEMVRDIDADTVDFIAELRRVAQRAGGAAGALPEPARQRLRRHRRRHGDEHPAAQPARGDRRGHRATSTTRRSTLDGLMKHLPGPDFPTGGIIVGRSGIREAYETGRGRVVVRARAHVEPLRQGKEAIIVTEMPYQVTKGDGKGDGSAA